MAKKKQDEGRATLFEMLMRHEGHALTTAMADEDGVDIACSDCSDNGGMPVLGNVPRTRARP